jgi:hypothetical protein
MPETECWKDCHFPKWAGGCPYLYTLSGRCGYYGPNYNEEESEEEEEE